jgi:hypothetical protein
VDERDEALQRVTDLIERFALTPGDVRESLARRRGASRPAEESHGPRKVAILLAGLGAALTLAGVLVLTARLWVAIGVTGVVTVTVGTGLLALALAYVSAGEPRGRALVTPLYVVSALAQPIGMAIFFADLRRPPRIEVELLAVAGVMAAQGALLAVRSRGLAIACATLLFGAIALTAALDLAGIDGEINAILVGATFFAVAWGLRRTDFEPIAPLWLGASAACVLPAWLYWTRGGAGELTFTPLVAACLWLSVLLSSRALLAVGAAAVVLYLGDLSHRYFVDALGWPLVLIGLGGASMVAATAAVRLRTRFPRPAG